MKLFKIILQNAEPWLDHFSSCILYANSKEEVESLCEKAQQSHKTLCEGEFFYIQRNQTFEVIEIKEPTKPLVLSSREITY